MPDGTSASSLPAVAAARARETARGLPASPSFSIPPALQRSVDRPLAFSAASAACGLASFATLPLRGDGPLAHAAQNATWGLIVGAVVLGLLATDGIGQRKLPRNLVILGVLAAAARALLAFRAMLPEG